MISNILLFTDTITLTISPMFSILIHDEFADSPPDVWEEFDNITDAVGYFNQMKGNDKMSRYADVVELVLETVCDDGFTDRFTLETFKYV